MPKEFYPNGNSERVLIPDSRSWRNYTRGLYGENQRVDLPEHTPHSFPVVVNEEHGDGWCGTIAVRVTVVSKAHALELPQYQFQFDGAQYVPAEK